MKKRLFGILLCSVLTISVFPHHLYAEEIPDGQEDATEIIAETTETPAETEEILEETGPAEVQEAVPQESEVPEITAEPTETTESAEETVEELNEAPQNEEAEPAIEEEPEEAGEESEIQEEQYSEEEPLADENMFVLINPNYAELPDDPDTEEAEEIYIEQFAADPNAEYTKADVEQKERELAAAKQAVADAQAVVQSGSRGFFEQHSGVNSNAILILDEGAKGAEETLTGIGRTNLGAKEDATSLENMKVALEYIIEGNDLRASDEHNTGINKNPLKVTDELMAYAQVNANASREVEYHWFYLKNESELKLAWYGENLSLGYPDPYDGWYTEEKVIYEKGETEGTGHYLNLVNPDNKSSRQYTCTGFGCAKGGRYRRSDVQTFAKISLASGFSSGKQYTVEQYNADFTAYYDAVTKKLSDAKAAEVAAQKAYDTVKKAYEAAHICDNGHDFVVDRWDWNLDDGRVFVRLVCKNNPEHRESSEAIYDVETVDSTYSEHGYKIYTAAACYGSNTYSDTKKVEFPLKPIPKTPGLYYVDGQWKYYDNAVFTKATGLVLRPDNKKWYYVENGIYKKATGIVPRVSDRKWFYVQNGGYSKATGLARRVDNGKWYYVENGAYKKSTGLVRRIDNGRWFYIENGAYVKKTGLTQRVDNKKWYYVNNGAYTKWTGVVPRIPDGKPFYVKNGVYDTSFNGTAKDASGANYQVTKGRAVKK